jgi:molecular chaperone GrpE
MGEKNKNHNQRIDEENTEEVQTSQQDLIDKSITEEKIDQLQDRISQLEKERDDLKDKFLRKAAEFENYKRRTEQELSAFTKYAHEQLIVDLLPILDDFERSLHISKERREFGAFYKGIELIYEKFSKLLQSKGVKPIESEGKPFDVDLHNALMQVPKDNVDPSTVIEEVEKGYLYNDKVIRYAKVIVAKEPDDDNMQDEINGDSVNNEENS